VEEVISKEALIETRESLEWEADSEMERLARALVMMLRVFLDKAIEEYGIDDTD